MCGIFSIFSKEPLVSRERIGKAIEQIKHRGPDSEGIWISDDRKVGLGHKRLSIIDLAGGEQPISDADRSIHIVVNGEFYDFERIRGELEKSGFTFRTRSDSEIALHLYERYGMQCLESLRGEFAFVISDQKNRRLIAARDRFGIKPLYYCIQDGTVFVGSEIKSLFAAGVRPEWDHEGFLQFSHFLVTFQDRTLFKNVYQVPPGHYILVTENNFKIVRYWDIDYDKSIIGRRLNDEEYIESFKEKFDESVRLRMRADVPVGCYLSGGIDSSAIAVTAKSHYQSPLKLFTLSFEQEEYDETSKAKEIAKHIGLDVEIVPVNQTDLATSFGDAVWHNESPFINTHSVAKYILSRAVRTHGIKTVLTGEGADEVCAGYMPFKRDMILSGSESVTKEETEKQLKELEANNKLTSGVFVAHGEFESLEKVKNTLGFVPSFFQSFSSNANKFKHLFSEDYARSTKGVDVYSLFLDDLYIDKTFKSWHPLDKSLYLWSKSLLPNYNLSALGDRMEMANSIEGRVPFLDHKLVELVGKFPADMKIRETTEKYVLREAMRERIPNAVYRRQKFAFKAPPATIVSSGESFALLQDTLRGSQMDSLPFFNKNKVIKLLDQLPEMDEVSKLAVDSIFTSLMGMCILSERFGL